MLMVSSCAAALLLARAACVCVGGGGVSRHHPISIHCAVCRSRRGPLPTCVIPAWVHCSRALQLNVLSPQVVRVASVCACAGVPHQQERPNRDGPVCRDVWGGTQMCQCTPPRQPAAQLSCRRGGAVCFEADRGGNIVMRGMGCDSALHGTISAGVCRVSTGKARQRAALQLQRWWEDAGGGSCALLCSWPGDDWLQPWG
jgi:hypothetical protein